MAPDVKNLPLPFLSYEARDFPGRSRTWLTSFKGLHFLALMCRPPAIATPCWKYLVFPPTHGKIFKCVRYLKCLWCGDEMSFWPMKGSLMCPRIVLEAPNTKQYTCLKYYTILFHLIAQLLERECCRWPCHVIKEPNVAFSSVPAGSPTGISGYFQSSAPAGSFS